jgi:hypothetical protein
MFNDPDSIVTTLFRRPGIRKKWNPEMKAAQPRIPYETCPRPYLVPG